MKTARGTKVYLAFHEDVAPNLGGYWVEIYLDPNGDRHDDFCIHPEDCDCSDFVKVVMFADDYVSRITDY